MENMKIREQQEYKEFEKKTQENWEKWVRENKLSVEDLIKEIYG